MRLAWLELSDFRSYVSVRVEPAPGINVFVGANGAGKTNLLEAVGYLAALKSVRGAHEEALVALESEAAVVRGEIRRGESEALIEIEIPIAGRKSVFVNRQRLSRASDMLGHVRAIAFIPEDLDVMKRGPAYRRDFLDAVAVQLRPTAYLDQQEFAKTLRQRNALLRLWANTADDRSTLEVWDRRMAQAGAAVMARRAETIEALGPYLTEIYQRLAEEELAVTATYSSPWTSLGSSQAQREGELLAALQASHKRDTARRTTSVGPHRDEPGFRIGARDARTHASQGEQRTLALSAKLAAHRTVSEATGTEPLLLLDDVFSELDLKRAAALASVLPQAQTFITTARFEEVPVSGTRWTVSMGRVTRD